jgi:hypothetical protein
MRANGFVCTTSGHRSSYMDSVTRAPAHWPTKISLSHQDLLQIYQTTRNQRTDRGLAVSQFTVLRSSAYVANHHIVQ